ncbi:LamG-like jellyroll fold domain-containing protein [Actinoplanes sp. NPDC049265]|uniref:LamG-like jellyroll fold domain-containing protein n=1 Tax=Actinoplanes sp. NPDC049265 TaxID=3363902 RepID=UPI00370FF1E5
MKRAVAVGIAASLLASGSAYGFWSTSGSGSGTSSVTTTAPLTLSPGTPATRVYPGGTANVAVTVANPNSFGVHIGALSLDNAQGTGGFAVDGAHSGCGVGVLSFAAQTNAGDGWTVPAGGSLGITLAGALSMTTAAANACQGATFTVYLAADVDAYTLVRRTAGLVSLWRLGTGPTASDNFTGSTTFSAGVVTPANRLRRNTITVTSVAASSAGQAVMTDIVPVTLVTGDALGVAARISGNSYYAARYQTSDTTWRLVKVINGVETGLGSAAATLTPGNTYRLRLEATGTSLRLSVNGTVLTTATDTALSAAGRAGLALGVTGSPAITDTTGLHADNFRIYPVPSSGAADVAGPNSGTYQGTVVQNEPGALAGDLNGSVTLDGVAGAMRVAAPTGLPVGAGPRSAELWFKRTDTGPADLFGYGSASSGKLFAGRLTSATGLRLDAFSAVRDWTLPYGTSDGAWHHVVLAYDGGTVQAYLDGTALGAQSLVLNTALDGTGFTAGTFAGSLDELAVYSVALSAGTVLDHYRAGHGS